MQERKSAAMRIIRPRVGASRQMARTCERGDHCLRGDNQVPPVE